ncbi:MAG: hypothetical protein Q8O88_00195 [bacterium]|nr:hypothetical protein [bacterium]
MGDDEEIKTTDDNTEDITRSTADNIAENLGAPDQADKIKKPLKKIIEDLKAEASNALASELEKAKLVNRQARGDRPAGGETGSDNLSNDSQEAPTSQSNSKPTPNSRPNPQHPEGPGVGSPNETAEPNSAPEPSSAQPKSDSTAGSDKSPSETSATNGASPVPGGDTAKPPEKGKGLNAEGAGTEPIQPEKTIPDVAKDAYGNAERGDQYGTDKAPPAQSEAQQTQQPQSPQTNPRRNANTLQSGIRDDSRRKGSTQANEERTKQTTASLAKLNKKLSKFEKKLKHLKTFNRADCCLSSCFTGSCCLAPLGIVLFVVYLINLFRKMYYKKKIKSTKKQISELSKNK